MINFRNGTQIGPTQLGYHNRDSSQIPRRTYLHIFRFYRGGEGVDACREGGMYARVEYRMNEI
jgi:hypothetical protein